MGEAFDLDDFPTVSSLTVTSAEPDVSGRESLVTVSVQVQDTVGVECVDFFWSSEDQMLADGALACEPTSGTPTSGTYTATFTIPANAPDGYWYVNAAAMDTDGLASETVSTTVDITSEDPDELAPTLTQTRLSTTGVDTTDGPGRVTLAFDAADPAGVTSVIATALNPNSGQVVEATASSPSSGSPTQGSWRLPLAIPRGAGAGEWYVSVIVADAFGNSTGVDVGTVMSQNSATPDTDAPTVTPTAIGAPAVDVTAESIAVPVSVEVEDPAGVAEAWISGTHRGMSLFLEGMLEPPVPGMPTQGTWTGFVEVPRGLRPGTIDLQVDVLDRLGNFRTVTIGSVKVSNSDPDTFEPVISETTTSPATVDVTGESAIVSVTARIQDTAGVEAAAVELQSRSTDHVQYSRLSQLIAGTPQDGIWQFDVLVPADAADGEWQAVVMAIDRLSPQMSRALAPSVQVTSADPDLEGPAADDLVVDPFMVAVAEESQRVDVRFGLTDRSGVASVRVSLADASGWILDERYPPGPVSGTRQDGLWASSFLFPQHSMENDFTVTVEAYDDHGQYARAAQSASIAVRNSLPRPDSVREPFSDNLSGPAVDED